MEFDIVHDVLEEIALEGLDGITIDTLWMRLSKRPKFSLDVEDADVKNYLWKHLITSPKFVPSKIEHFSLLADRAPVVYYNRFERINPDNGVYVEDAQIPPDPYAPLNPVKGSHLKGSCIDFESREPLNETTLKEPLSLSEASSKYGSRLVIVASQELRYEALGLLNIDPSSVISDMVYSYLERVGRSRDLGLVTIGREALLSSIKAKTGFYYRKNLLRLGLIRKAPHYASVSSTGISKGFVVYLDRFYQRRETPMETAARRISDFLLEQPDQECDYASMNDNESLNHIGRRIFKFVFGEYHKNFAIDVKEVQLDNNKKAKRKCVRLLKPVVVDFQDEEELEVDMDDDDDEEGDLTESTSIDKLRGLYDPRVIVGDRTILSQVLMLIESPDCPDGLSMTDIRQKLPLSRLDCRTFVRNLEKSKVIKSIKVDNGRARLTKYIPLSKVADSEKVFALERKGLIYDESDTIVGLRRSHIILEYVENLDVKVVDNIHTLKKLIMKAESDRPYVVDKRSIIRLVAKLQRAGKLKMMTVSHPVGSTTIENIMVYHPSIPDDSEIIQDRKEQWLFKLQSQLGAIKGDANAKRHKRRRTAKTKEDLDPEEQECGAMEYRPSIGKKYGVEPKMQKIFTFYSFLHHLLYVLPNQQEGVEYEDWRKFIHPLPEGSAQHSCTLGDVVPRLPLSVFVKVVCITYVVPDVEEFLEDPDKCNLTMIMLPPVLRQRLMFRRKHMFALHELLTWLSLLNLAEIEYTENFPKESLALTLKNKTRLRDKGRTTDYTLDTYQDVSVFLDDVMSHCSSEECEDCILDPRLFPHNKRNWTFHGKFRRMSALEEYNKRSLRMSNSTTLVLRDQQKVNVEIVPTPREKGKRGTKRRASANSAAQKKLKTTPEPVHEVVPFKMRKRKARKPSGESRRQRKAPAYDNVDHAALKLMKKHRVSWSEQEDNFLLLCRVASLLIDPTSRYNLCVKRSVVRDELHKTVAVSADKTGLACQRRVLYMCKDQRISQNIAEWVAEFKQDANFSSIQRPDVPRTYEKEWTEAFLLTLHKVVNKFMAPHLTQTLNIAVNEKNIDDYELVKTVSAVELAKKDLIYHEARNFVDIHVSVVDNVLLSTLLLNYNEALKDSAFSYALFKIYQRYPDTLIRSVVQRLQKSNVMAKCKNKSDPSALKQHGVVPYKISQHYLFLLQTKFGMNELINPFETIPVIMDTDQRYEALYTTSLFTAGKAEITLEVPDNFIILDDKFFSNKEVLVKEVQKSSSRSLLAFRQHLDSSRTEKSTLLQESLVLAKCKVVCSPKNGTSVDSSAFKSHLEYLRKDFPEKVSTAKADKDPLVQFVKSKKELGASRDEIFAFSGNWPSKRLRKLEDSFAIYRLGVSTFRWVHAAFTDPWVVISVLPESGDTPERRIKYVAKCWKKPNSETDKKTVFRFMSGLLGHIMSFPGVGKDEILTHFRIIMPGEQILEMLELLEVTKCITRHDLSLESKPRLFTPSSLKTFILYEPTPEAPIYLAQIRHILNA